MKTYELNIHFSGKLEEKEAVEAFEKIKKNIGGKILKEEEMKKINLAYPIKKELHSFLASLTFEALPENVLKFRETLRHEETLLRYLLSIKNIVSDKSKERKIRRATRGRPRKEARPRPGKKVADKEEKETPKITKEPEKKEMEKIKKIPSRKESKIKLEDIDKSLEQLLEKEL